METVLEEIGDGDMLDDAGRVLAVVGDGRLGALVCGPGLGRDPATAAAVRQVVLAERRTVRPGRRRAVCLRRAG